MALSEYSIQLEEEFRGLWNKYPGFMNNTYAKNVVGGFFTNQKIKHRDWTDEEFGEILTIFNYAAGLTDREQIRSYDLPHIYEIFWKYPLEAMNTVNANNIIHVHKKSFVGLDNARAYFKTLQQRAIENDLDILIDTWLSGISAQDITA